ncbi:hypothetical protein FA13DRAFT_1709676 [Coprinellus micaceus]|uniref:Uncharacterized protein n=1 Tax=Coprinellus micaceus TaxID=71717 RepID=A0A4Y7TBA8_COPMI|nr:hypothetical protein FA13DRAFT_1709676 [Coprinellus micaceus]
MPSSPNADIVSVVNEQTNLGMLGSMARILDVLEVISVFPETDLRLNGVTGIGRSHHLTMQPPEGSAFAVQFTAIAARNMQPLCLAYAVARFQEMYSADWGRRDLRMVKLHYEFTEGVVFGVMFYDILPDEAVDNAVTRARDRDDDHFTFHGEYPVSFWNATAADFAGGLKHSHCETYLCCTMLRLYQAYNRPTVESQGRGTLHLGMQIWANPSLISV